MILLVHSCETRRWLQRHWMKFFYRSGWNIRVKYIWGSEAFTDQLKNALEKISDKYVFYMLDDFFIRFPIEFNKYIGMAKSKDALRLQPGVQINSLPYRFKREGELLRQLPDSEYKISLQSSIWRREYFLECLKPGIDPWSLELSNCKLGNVYWVPHLPRWYIDATLKGVLRSEAKKMINDI